MGLQVHFATATVDLVLDTTRFYRELTRAHIALTTFQRSWTVTLNMNAAPAQARMNLVLQQLQNLQSHANLNLGARGGGVGGRGGGGGGPGFLSGVWMGSGLPYAANPQMMAGQMVGAGLNASIQQAMKMESSMASLRRVGGFSAEETGGLQKDIFKLAREQAGTTVEDVTEIADVGARAGIRGGPSQIMEFVKDVAMVKNAVGDMPTEELTNRMVQVLNVFEAGTERAKNFGSALVAMDQASTATARDILDVTTRLSGTARQIQLTIPQTVALAATLKNVGLTNEVAGSSFSQIFRKMHSESGKFAAALGIDMAAYAHALRTDPMDALGLIIGKLKELDDTIQGQEFIDSLGLRGVRVGGALQQLASKFGDIEGLTQQAAKETETLNALLSAQAIKSNTAASAIENLTDAFKGLGTALGEKALPAIADWARMFTGVVAGEPEANSPETPALRKAGVGAPLKGVDKNRSFFGLSAETAWMSIWHGVTGTGGEELENLRNLMAQKMQRANEATAVIKAAEPLPAFGEPGAMAAHAKDTMPAGETLKERIAKGIIGAANISQKDIGKIIGNVVDTKAGVQGILMEHVGIGMHRFVGQAEEGEKLRKKEEKESEKGKREQRVRANAFVGLSTGDLNAEIQRNVFKQFAEKDKDDDQKATKENTSNTVRKLGTIETVLRDGFKSTVAVLSQ